jgi:hypothetical protein
MPSEATTVTGSLGELLEAPPVSAGPPVSAVPAAAPPLPPVQPMAPMEPAPVSVGPASLPPTSMPPSSLSPADAMLPSLEEALRQRVRVGQGAGPLWAFVLIAVFASLALVSMVSALFSTIVARTTAPTRTASSVVAPVTAPQSAAVAPSSAPVPNPPTSTTSVTERAAQAEPDAIAQIEKRAAAERSVDEVVALSAGRAEEKRRKIHALVTQAKGDAVFAASDDLAKDLRAAANDPDVARDALQAMAEIPTSLGPDVLHATWAAKKKSDPSRQLAEELLQTVAVRRKASSALLVVLDARAAESCESAKDALERAEKYGDRRVLSALGRFRAKNGCGDDQREDCFPCLRSDDVLKRATQAVVKRAPPSW